MNTTTKTISTNKRINCEISIGQYNMWIRHVVSGFYDLHKSGVINLVVRPEDKSRRVIPRLAAVIDSRVRVVYDAHDGYNFLLGAPDPVKQFDDLLDQCDLWFKYTCVESNHLQLRNKAKIRPLGLGSGFFGSMNNPYDIGLAPFNLRQVVQTAIGASDFLSSLTRFNSRHIKADEYEHAPDSGDGRVLYVGRLWDPDAPEVENDQIRDERRGINIFRAELVREARRVLGQRFIGGLQRDAYSARHYPDCIYDGPEASNRWAYLKTMRGVSVGIASAGLHSCSSGKLAEYVAASRGVVSTPLPMSLPGRFLAGHNYLEASSPGQIIGAAFGLLNSPEVLCEMMRANYAYYQQYVKPASLVLRTIQVAVG